MKKIKIISLVIITTLFMCYLLSSFINYDSNYFQKKERKGHLKNNKIDFVYEYQANHTFKPLKSELVKTSFNYSILFIHTYDEKIVFDESYKIRTFKTKKNSIKHKIYDPVQVFIINDKENSTYEKRKKQCIKRLNSSGYEDATNVKKIMLPKLTKVERQPDTTNNGGVLTIVGP